MGNGRSISSPTLADRADREGDGARSNRPGPHVDRIMFVVHRLGHGGAEQQVAALATRFAAKGRDVIVVAALHGEHERAEDLRSSGVTVVDLNAWGLRRTILPLAREIRRWKPEVVHTHGLGPNIAGRLARLRTRSFSLVCTTHNLGESEHPYHTPFWHMRYRLTDPMAALTTNVCRTGLERYIEAGAIPRSKALVVPNGIDVDRFRPNPAARACIRAELSLGESPTLIAVGRIDKGKGYETMLDAFAGVKGGDQPVLLLVGSGTEDCEIRKRATSLGLGARVRFLGPRDDTADLLNAADGYLMASWSEALPLVLLEASAVGLPLVVTDVGGNADVVVQGLNGLLVPPKDVEALRRGIETLLSMPESERRSMGAAGRARTVAEFSLDHVVERWDEIYSYVAGQRSRRPVRGSASR